MRSRLLNGILMLAFLLSTAIVVTASRELFDALAGR